MAATTYWMMVAVLLASCGGSLGQSDCLCGTYCTDNFPGDICTLVTVIQSGRRHTNPNCAPPADLGKVVNVGSTVYIYGTTNLCAAVNGDPVVTGFDGAQFEFAGVAGQAYSFLSTPDHSLNIGMVPANLSQKAAGGTIIGSASMTFRNHTVQASADKHGNLTVLVDDTVVTRHTLESSANHAAEFYFEDDNTVSIQLFRPYFGHSVRMETSLLVATFFVTPPGLDAYYNQVVRGYLNLAIQLKETADLSGMHGVLGQTILGKATEPAGVNATALNTITAFSGEGVECDYQVSSLTASDSKFNTFGKLPVKRQVARRVLAKAVATVPLGIAFVAN